MITLTSKINLLSGDNKALLLGSDNLSGNNISSDLSSVVGVKKNGSNPFIIGASRLGDGSTFSNGEDYFIDDQLSDENGDFKTHYNIQINSKKIFNHLTIAFDTINNRHPKSILISENKEYREKQKIGEDYQNFSFSIEVGYSSFDVSSVNVYDETNEIYGNNSIRYEKSGSEIIIYNGGVNGWLSGNKTYIFSVVITATKEIIDDDPVFTISNIDFQNPTLKIKDWNVPNYPLVITGIYAEVTIEIDRRNIISLESSTFDRSDLKLPSFGIISNTGNIEFNDLDGEIRDYAEQLLLQSGLSCEIKLNNTLVDGASETIGLFETDQWNYGNNSRVVSVSLKDDLEEWQEINVAEIPYDPRKKESKPFSWLYEHLWKLTSNRSSYVNDKGETIIGKGNYNMFSIVELDENTQAVLNNTYIQYPLLESGSLWQQWTKLCQACQMHIYKNSKGIVVCRYNGGN